MVYDLTPLPKINFSVSADAQPTALKNKVQSYWYFILVALAFISFNLTTYFSRLHKKLKKQKINIINQNQNAYQNLINSFSGKVGTFNIPFHNNNFLILPEPKLSEVATQMRKRVSDDATYIHIEKTISKTILNGGFFNPVISARTQQSEFLVLIDNNNNNQQVKLFQFLIDLLKKQNVYIDTYYFKKSLRHCYYENEKTEISLEKLSEKYSEHILLIFGSAHQLIYPDYPAIHRYCLSLLNRWQYKAIITPVSYMDWGNKEKKILLPQLPVFPVDIYGQLILMEKLFGENVNILSLLDKSTEYLYDVEMIDFEDIDELLDYCSAVEWANIPNESNYSNMLFQWIAALAVYPKITWELTIKIGKAILDKHDLKQKLNFTTLLRLVRISWMTSGNFPDFVRLNLLKHLSVENEITAREAILHALNEIPQTELNDSHFAFEEKETQRIINEFNLYAYNTTKYAEYSHAKELFAKLCDKDLITDITAKTYLENANLNWQTLINKQQKPNDATLKPKNITLEEFLEEKPEKKSTKEKVYLWAKSFCALLFLASLLGIVVLAFLDGSGNYKLTPFTSAPLASKDIKINYDTDISNNSTMHDVTLSIDSVSVKLSEASKTNNNAQPVSSQIPVLINELPKRVIINWGNKPVFDSIMTIEYDAYNVMMKASAFMDEDADGVLDKDDDCPNEAGVAKNNGCPFPDTDGDGVLDKDDKCPDEKGTIANKGCPEPPNRAKTILEQKKKDYLRNIKNTKKEPIDTDGDGVLDIDDACPEKVGTAANNGCPKVTEETQAPLNDYAKVVLFESGKSTIRKESSSALTEILNILKAYPKTSFIVEGHAADGEANKNEQTLSEQRVKYVKDFLVSNGISPSRLSTIGYGNSKPIASNRTSDGRAMNRRVELILNNSSTQKK